jgi:hypothetical protein
MDSYKSAESWKIGTGAGQGALRNNRFSNRPAATTVYRERSGRPTAVASGPYDRRARISVEPASAPWKAFAKDINRAVDPISVAYVKFGKVPPKLSKRSGPHAGCTFGLYIGDPADAESWLSSGSSTAAGGTIELVFQPEAAALLLGDPVWPKPRRTLHTHSHTSPLPVTVQPSPASCSCRGSTQLPRSLRHVFAFPQPAR